MRDFKDQGTIQSVIFVLEKCLEKYSRYYPYDFCEAARIGGYIEALFQTKFITESEAKKLRDVKEYIAKETRETGQPVPEPTIHNMLSFLTTDPAVYEDAPIKVDEFRNVVEYRGEKKDELRQNAIPQMGHSKRETEVFRQDL